jgi:hypothetical protein
VVLGYESAFGQFLTPADGDDKAPERKNLLIIGASSLISPLGQPQLVGALLESKGTPMNVEGKFFGTEPLDRMLSSRKVWDYVIMDAWQFRRGGTGTPEFPNAVAAFVKQVRAHSPRCKIILFPWWIPRGPDATNERSDTAFLRRRWGNPSGNHRRRPVLVRLLFQGQRGCKQIMTKTTPTHPWAGGTGNAPLAEP